MNNLHLILEAAENLENYRNKNAIELLIDNYPLSDNDSDDDSDSYNDNNNNSEKINILNVSMGRKNKQKKNSPINSKDQSYIYIHLDNKTIKRGTGWYVWNQNGIWYHLGGNKNRKPTIYKLITEKRFGWSKINDQSESYNLFNLYGKS